MKSQCTSSRLMRKPQTNEKPFVKLQKVSAINFNLLARHLCMLNRILTPLADFDSAFKPLQALDRRTYRGKKPFF